MALVTYVATPLNKVKAELLLKFNCLRLAVNRFIQMLKLQEQHKKFF